MSKKYELVKEDSTMFRGDIKAYRIRALRDIKGERGSISNIKKGQLGGYVQSEEHLSHEGNCWVGGNAAIVHKARVSENALVFNSAFVEGHARVGGNAIVCDHVHVSRHASVCGHAHVSGKVSIEGHAHVSGYAHITDSVRVNQHATVGGYASLFGNCVVGGSAHVLGGSLGVIPAYCTADTYIEDDVDYFFALGVGSEDGTLEAYKQKDGSILVIRGCFKGTLEEFLAAVEKTHGENKYGKSYRHLAEVIKLKLTDES